MVFIANARMHFYTTTKSNTKMLNVDLMKDALHQTNRKVRGAR